MFQDGVNMDACPSDICSSIVCDEKDGRRIGEYRSLRARALQVFVGELWRDGVRLSKEVQLDNSTPPDCPKSMRQVRVVEQQQHTSHTATALAARGRTLEGSTFDESRIEGIAIQHDAAAMLC